MRRGGWLSSHLSWVSAAGILSLTLTDFFAITDMLTPIDQPLDKLADLRSDEVYVSLDSGWVLLKLMNLAERT